MRPEWLRSTDTLTTPVPVRLVTEQRIGGNAVQEGDALAIQTALDALAAATLSRSGCYVLAETANAAQVKFSLIVALNQSEVAQDPTFELVRTPYLISQGPPQPTSVIDSRGVVRQRVTSSYAYPRLACGGRLEVTYTDAAGAERFRQSYAVPDRVFLLDQQRTGAGLQPLPTHLGAALEAFYPAYKSALESLTPTEFIQPLDLNDGGAPALRLLIQAGAYREAQRWLTNAPALTRPDRENQAILLRLLGQE